MTKNEPVINEDRQFEKHIPDNKISKVTLNHENKENVLQY